MIHDAKCQKSLKIMLLGFTNFRLLPCYIFVIYLSILLNEKRIKPLETNQQLSYLLDIYKVKVQIVSL